MYGLFKKVCLVQIKHFNKHTRFIKLYGSKISCKLCRTFAEKILQTWKWSYSFMKYFKKCNIKDYYLSYYYVINLNAFRIQCCSKNLLKIFENLLKMKLLIDTLQRFCQNFQYWHFEFYQCLFSLRILENIN